MDTIQEEDIDDDLKDFMTNFKFPWESEDNEVREDNGNRREIGITRVGQRSSGHLYLSDTTPARKGKRLSGKNLIKEYSVATCDSASSITVDRGVDTGSTKNSDLPAALNHITAYENNPENEPKSKDFNQTGQFVTELCSISSVTDRNYDSLLQTNKKQKRRQSSHFKRRESLALLKTIGEVSSPCYKDKLQQAPSKLQDGEEKSSSHNARLQREAKKSKTRTSRRRSTRLSGISRPMLELGANGIPKLVQQSQHSEVFDSTPRLMAIQAEKPFEKDETFKNTEEELGYRNKHKSPVTPLQNSKLVVTSDMDSQYYTPQNYKVCNVELCSPEQSVLTSLSSLQLQGQCPSDSVQEQEIDNCSGLESLGKSCEEIPCQKISHEESNMLEAVKERDKIPEKDKEGLLEENHQKCEILMEGDLTEKRETEMDISEWKENLDDPTSSTAPSCHTWTSSTSLFDEVEVDPKVRDIYLKKGQLKPFKKKNTNLETVFEDQKTDEVSFGKRKYRRSLAFPEKPWVPRKSKRGANKQKGCKKKRLSLSKTSKKNDTLLRERLNDILDSLVEEC